MLPVWANGETFVSATMCPQQCVLVCQGLNNEHLYITTADDHEAITTCQVLKVVVHLKKILSFLLLSRLSLRSLKRQQRKKKISDTA